jgi:hypothetical protein
MNVAINSAKRGGTLYRFAPARPWCAASALSLLDGCNGAPSRNILGSYFPSWMVCALVGIALALPLRRHAGNRLRGHLRDVADMAVLNNAHE